MDYQKIRAAIENPLLTAFNDLSPSVPVYFDNITAVPPNTTTEYVRVNVTFGITNEPTLTGSVDFARGAVIIRVFTEKGRGPARNQTLLTTAVDVLETLNETAKTAKVATLQQQSGNEAATERQRSGNAAKPRRTRPAPRT